MANELPNPDTRDEKYLAKAAGVEVAIPYPETRNEKYLAKAGGMEIETPTPLTREEKYLNAIAEGGGGGSAILIEKTITTNGEYSAVDDEADGYSSVSVDVANSYTASDEGKVVSSGELVAQTSTTATANGTIDTTTNNEVVVNVPNSYTAGDEGKVVDNGQLIAQTSATFTENATYDTTLVNSVTVNVPSGIEACELIKSSGLGGEVLGFNTEDRTIVAGLLYKAASYSSIVLTFPQGFTPRYTKSPYGAWSVYYDYGYGSPRTFDGVNITDSSITFTISTLKGFDNSSQTKQIPICIQFTTN